MPNSLDSGRTPSHMYGFGCTGKGVRLPASMPALEAFDGAGERQDATDVLRLFLPCEEGEGFGFSAARSAFTCLRFED